MIRRFVISTASGFLSLPLVFGKHLPGLPSPPPISPLPGLVLQPMATLADHPLPRLDSLDLAFGLNLCLLRPCYIISKFASYIFTVIQ
ncbi:hypothetical protein DAEQUDRAFT_730317 [Daedalea quercina L-15889]|uniref:Uncharacterized protein n=1 Tax=Daedalea quercina L-15889 TaxID=1314783 RepID=A0A165N059_9APHY|nr:hypothetical protein DAEQUDRAFT_730317 [Daedalea quercina L-15889]